MTGARHKTDETGESGESDMPDSYGPNPTALAVKSKATIASRQDENIGSILKEPRPGKELDFN